MITSEEIIDSLSFCVIDLETTGGNHQKDKIIEIGMVRVKERKITEKKSFLINPETVIPDFIQKLTKISQASVKDSPIIEDVIDDIISFIGDDIIVAHNTSFDVPFLNGTILNLGREKLQNKVICTNVMTKHLIPEILSSNLNYMSRLFNINHSKAHRAHDDALATAKLLIIYLSVFVSKGIKKVNQLYYPRNKFELDRAHFDQGQSNNEILQFLQTKTSSCLVIIKGDRGLILAVIPLESPQDECDIVQEVLEDLNWQIITVKLLKPFIEGLFQFNNHFYKYPEETREKILTYLTQRYSVPYPPAKKLERYDFILCHHLVSDQIMVYSFFNLNTSTKNIFKVPAQNKKLYQHLTSQISRFENQQKGRRKHLIHKELVPLTESFLALSMKQNRYLSLDRKSIRQDKESTMQLIESFARDDINKHHFPTYHL